MHSRGAASPPPGTEGNPGGIELFFQKVDIAFVHRRKKDMSFSHQYTQKELDYIRDNWGRVPVAKMASKLGRSRSSVYKKAHDMRIGGKPSQDGASPMESRGEKCPSMDSVSAFPGRMSIGEDVSDHDRLAGLRDLIWNALLGAEPSDIAKLAPEYRKTIEEMIQLDGGRTGGTEDGGGGSLAEVIRL